MRKFLLGSTALLALIGAANAADLPRPAPAPAYVAPAAVPYTWTGFYGGGAFGYGVWDMNSSVVLPAGAIGTTNNGGRGWLGQAIGGFDYQFAVWNFNLVAGAFADWTGGDLSGTSNFQAATAPFATMTGLEKEKSFWDVGGRIGWLPTPQILSYFSAGYSQAHYDGMNLQSVPGFPMSTSSHNYHGWFTGGGIETQVQSIPGLFFNTEYRYYGYNNATLPVAGSTAVFGTPVSLKLEPHVQTVMSGVRYKFNWGP
jgi:outer membrane immunogenic protein